MILCLTGTPIDVTVYDIQRISIIAEHSQPVVVRTAVAYKGKSINIHSSIKYKKKIYCFIHVST
jgi:hypothetical protein